MQGRILGFDSHTGAGMISAEDGQRYPFDTADWKQRGTPQPGQKVDFETDRDRATGIYLIGGGSALAADKNRIVAALLALFLGTLGIHKFYLGKMAAGLIMLACGTIGWFFILPGAVVTVIALIEALIYLITPDAVFQRKYVEGTQSWF